MENTTNEQELSKTFLLNVMNQLSPMINHRVTTMNGAGDPISIVYSGSKNVANSLELTVNQPNLKKLTRSENVKIFTEESKGVELPNHPRKMTRDEVSFLVKMVIEELQELLLTVTNEKENVKELLTDIVCKSNSPTYTSEGKSDLELMAEQVDAFVDIDYYNCNAAAKVGFNVDDVFDLVHQANMSKKFGDGTFHKNQEGKVIKPSNWTEPDVKAVVSKWMEQGTWTNK